VSGPLILVCMAIYFTVCVDQLRKGDPWAALMWASYGTANIALFMKAK
jgi:hypothetical protein